MDYNCKNCGVVESICAELVGSFIICGILLPGSTLKPQYRFVARAEAERANDTSTPHPFVLTKGGFETFENAMTYGLTVASTMAYTVYISGGHLNPVITLGALICGYIRVIPALCYVLAQTVGALLGEVAATLITEKYDNEVGEVDARSAFALGMLSSFVIVTVFLSVFDPKKFGRDDESGSLAVGLAETVIACSTDYRGTVNPAVSLAVAMHYENFNLYWVHWVAPLVGALLAALVYRAITSYPSSSFVRINYSTPLVVITTSNS